MSYGKISKNDPERDAEVQYKEREDLIQFDNFTQISGL